MKTRAARKLLKKGPRQGKGGELFPPEKARSGGRLKKLLTDCGQIGGSFFGSFQASRV